MIYYKTELKEKVADLAGCIDYDIHGKKYYFPESLQIYFKNDPDCKIIKEKLDNLIKLMNESNTNGQINQLGELDFEKDIWNKI